MQPVKVSITVPNSREEVYAHLDVLANHGPFTDNMLVDWSYAGPARGVGARARMRVKKPGRADWLDMEVIAADPPRATTEESVSAGGRRRTRGTYLLGELPDGAGTKVSFRFEWLQAPLIERLGAPLTRAVIRRGNRRSLERLAERLTRPPMSSASPHARLDALPEWPARTIGFLATIDGGPHAIPISAPVRAGERRILLSLHRERGSLARLREDPSVALLVLAEGDVAFTARGRGEVIAEPLPDAPDYVAVAIEVDEIDDHRQAAFQVDSSVGRTWVDESEQRALGERVGTLRRLAGEARNA